MKSNIIESNNNRIPRMRTIAQAYKAIKESDPNTAFTMRALRRMQTVQQLKEIIIS